MANCPYENYKDCYRYPFGCRSCLSYFKDIENMRNRHLHTCEDCYRQNCDKCGYTSSILIKGTYSKTFHDFDEYLLWKEISKHTY